MKLTRSPGKTLLMLLVGLGLGLVLVASIGCQSISVSTDWDTSHDFSQYKSYAWLPEPPDQTAESARLHNALIDSRVREAVNSQLASKGYRYSSIEGADLLVTYYLGLESKIDVDTIYSSYGYGYRGWYGAPAGPQTVVRQYEEGSLLLDFLEPKSRALLWRGSASTRVGGNSNPEKSRKTINAAVEKILKKFPPEN